MIKDVESSAAALAAGGWESTDKEELREQYHLLEDEVDAICAALERIESDNRQANEYPNIRSALESGNESGIICYPGGTAAICNWACTDGMPGHHGEIIVSRRGCAESWREMLEGYTITLDENNDFEAANDCACEWVKLTDGTIIIAPKDWN